MAFKWSEYLDLAQFLYNNGSNINQVTQESAYRSAISRAYYAVFCYAREYAFINYGFITTKSTNIHKEVENQFRRKGLLKIADNLRDLRIWRNQCDYDNEVDDISSMIQKSIIKAQEILSRI